MLLKRINTILMSLQRVLEQPVSYEVQDDPIVLQEILRTARLINIDLIDVVVPEVEHTVLSETVPRETFEKARKAAEEHYAAVMTLGPEVADLHNQLRREKEEYTKLLQAHNADMASWRTSRDQLQRMLDERKDSFSDLMKLREAVMNDQVRWTVGLLLQNREDGTGRPYAINKIQLIKVLRGRLGLSLKEAHDIVNEMIEGVVGFAPRVYMTKQEAVNEMLNVERGIGDEPTLAGIPVTVGVWPIG